MNSDTPGRAIQRELFDRAVRSGASYLSDRYTTSGGALRPKGKARKLYENADLATWAEAVWIANGRVHTPNYWRGQILEAARDLPIGEPT